MTVLKCGLYNLYMYIVQYVTMSSPCNDVLACSVTLRVVVAARSVVLFTVSCPVETSFQTPAVHTPARRALNLAVWSRVHRPRYLQRRLRPRRLPSQRAGRNLGGLP